MIDRGGPVPPYRQLAGILRDRIESGDLPPGSALPSISKLAAEHGMSEFTVKKAIRVLKDEGLVEGVAGYGTFIRAPAG